LHLTPDESPRTPGKFPPYIQTEKLKRYQELAHQLLGEHKAYYCFCSKEELEHQREEALKNGHTPKYNRSCAHLSAQEVQNKLDNKIPGVIRLKMPDNIDIK
jgi:glutamyl-tRNA synthetase